MLHLSLFIGISILPVQESFTNRTSAAERVARERSQTAVVARPGTRPSPLRYLSQADDRRVLRRFPDVIKPPSLGLPPVRVAQRPASPESQGDAPLVAGDEEDLLIELPNAVRGPQLRKLPGVSYDTPALDQRRPTTPVPVASPAIDSAPATSKQQIDLPQPSSPVTVANPFAKSAVDAVAPPATAT
ncbi:MAG: hypothetical protein KDB23_24635, partial [Planctomycetales bacterium]|nr:hypothetical protein [Planctomycetales bacterium]